MSKFKMEQNLVLTYLTSNCISDRSTKPSTTVRCTCASIIAITQISLRPILPMSNDHLQLKGLAVNFDYLMFKISDRINSLAEQTHESVLAKSTAIENDYLQKQLQLNHVMAEIDACQKDCKELEALFAKLDQLYVFVDDFKNRLDVLERDFKTMR